METDAKLTMLRVVHNELTRLLGDRWSVNAEKSVAGTNLEVLCGDERVAELYVEGETLLVLDCTRMGTEVKVTRFALADVDVYDKVAQLLRQEAGDGACNRSERTAGAAERDTGWSPTR